MKATVEVDIVELELKYCERCGGLWLRETGTQDVYCNPCVAQLAEFPARGLKRGPRTERNHGSDIEGYGGEGLSYICGEGGHA